MEYDAIINNHKFFLSRREVNMMITSDVDKCSHDHHSELEAARESPEVEEFVCETETAAPSMHASSSPGFPLQRWGPQDGSPLLLKGFLTSG